MKDRIRAQDFTMLPHITPNERATEPETITPGRGTAESAAWFRANRQRSA